MFLLKKFLSAWFLPPFGLIVFAVVIVIFHTESRRKLRWIVSVALIFVLAMSLPIVADTLARPLGPPNPISAAALSETQAIVILGGGIDYGAIEYGGDTVSKLTLERLRYGAKLAHQSGLPVLVSGGSVYGGAAEAMLMASILEREYAVPVRWIEDRSHDTSENAYFSSQMLKTAGVSRVSLVTHAWHMARADSHFSRNGIQVSPAATGFGSQGMPIFPRLLPTTGALERSSVAIHEWVGILILKMLDR